jgi:hypothetical protein
MFALGCCFRELKLDVIKGFIWLSGANYHVTGFVVGRSPPWIHDWGNNSAALE